MCTYKSQQSTGQCLKSERSESIILITKEKLTKYKFDVRGHLGWYLVSSEGLNLLVVYWQIVYHIPIIPYFSCLYHVVRCLLSIIRTIVITDLCVMTWRKRLSYYLYFFFFSFLFILDLLHKRKYGKVPCHKCHTVAVTWQEVTASHHMMSHMIGMGK